MHPTSIFRRESAARNIAFARASGFGMLAVAAPGGAAPLLAHVPFLLDEDGALAELHLARPNPICAALRDGPLAAKIAIPGPHDYISPDWYGIADQVPTWNYVAVHLAGTLSLADPAALGDLLERQSRHFEERLLPKPVWLPGKMTPEVLSRMMRAILPVRLEVAQIDGTWKLGQNKPDEVRLAAAQGLESAGGDAGLAGLMRNPAG